MISARVTSRHTASMPIPPGARTAPVPRRVRPATRSSKRPWSSARSVSCAATAITPRSSCGRSATRRPPARSPAPWSRRRARPIPRARWRRRRPTAHEAASGPVTEAMVQTVRETDPSRPVIYEQDYRADYVDVFSLMYSTHEESAQIGQRSLSPEYQAKLTGMLRSFAIEADDDAFADPPALGKPFLWIEYAHAMGNGAGSLKEYMELTEKYPALHGGFIWEWIDHGLVTRDAEGNEIYGYGGDFGERLHDGNFVADGLVLPDRTPSPALLDAKHHYSPVGLEVSEGFARITNRYAFSDLSHL